MSITYRYHCSVEGVHVFETKAVGDPVPTVCINEGGALTADSLTIFRQPTELADLEITATVDFLSSVVNNLSHNQLGDIGLNSHATIDAHMVDPLVHKNDNYFATAAPIATNDESEGYTTGSRWYNTNTSQEYYCVNSNIGLAIWKKTSGIDDSASSTTTSYSSNKVVSDFSAVGHTHVAVDVTDFSTAVDANTNVSTNTTHRSQTDNPHTVTKAQVGLADVENLKFNLSATANPVVTDDSAAGYSVGSRWFNVTADEEYVCLDATATAAVWKKTTLDSNNNKFIVSSAEQSINNTAIWVGVDRFIYPGSSITAANVDRIMVNAFTDNAANSFDVRIVNITKTSGIPIVATSTGNVNTETAVINLNGQALDLPTVDDVFEVEVKKNSGDGTIFIRYSSVMMVYN